MTRPTEFHYGDRVRWRGQAAKVIGYATIDGRGGRNVEQKIYIKLPSGAIQCVPESEIE